MKRSIIFAICAFALLLMLVGCGNSLPKGYGYINVDFRSADIEGNFEYVNETTVKVTTESGEVYYIPTTSIRYITLKDKK